MKKKNTFGRDVQSKLNKFGFFLFLFIFKKLLLFKDALNWSKAKFVFMILMLQKD